MAPVVDSAFDLGSARPWKAAGPASRGSIVPADPTARSHGGDDQTSDA